MYKSLKLLILLIFISCECPPNLDTGKEIIPSEYSNVCFINLSETYPEIDVYFRKMLLWKGLQNTSSGTYSYVKFPVGNSNFNIKTQNEIIYNSIIYNKKDEFHTIIFYDKDYSANVLILNEEFKSQQENGSIRIIHLANYPKIIIKLISSLPQTIEIKLNTSESTNPIEFASGKLNLQILTYEDNKLIQEIENINIKLNYITNIVLTGDSTKLNFSILNSLNVK